MSAQLDIGSIIHHPVFGKGQIVSRDASSFLVAFDSGESKRIDSSFEGFSSENATTVTSKAATSTPAQPRSDELTEKLRELLDDFGAINPSAEIGKRWQGGVVKIIPGKEGAQPKEIPIDALFRKIISIREKLRVLEQKINNHPALSDPEKLELEAYITRCYGSLTSFNVLFATKEGQFTGMAGE